MINTTYYKKNREQKIIMKTIKKGYESKQEIMTEIYLKMIKIKGENMEETDTMICLKKRNKD